jgi:hypothetical protein
MDANKPAGSVVYPHMKRKQAPGTDDSRVERIEQSVYEMDFPLWRRYYQRVRKTVRFPRYYKKEWNW